MTINSERFGTIEMDGGEVIEFPTGLIGFPNERNFILVRHGDSGSVAWMQSTDNPTFALPVVSAHGFGSAYPDVPMEEAAQSAGICNPGDEMAVMAVLSAPRSGPATVNLMAPIVVNVATRKGAQILLDGTRFSTRELFFAPREAEPETDPAPLMMNQTDAEQHADAE